MPIFRCMIVAMISCATSPALVALLFLIWTLWGHGSCLIGQQLSNSGSQQGLESDSRVLLIYLRITRFTSEPILTRSFTHTSWLGIQGPVLRHQAELVDGLLVSHA